MKKAKRSLSLASVHHRTVTLEKAAGAMGDHFLQYLYRLARLHLEEQAGISHEELRKDPSSEDPDAEPDE